VAVFVADLNQPCGDRYVAALRQQALAGRVKDPRRRGRQRALICRGSSGDAVWCQAAVSHVVQSWENQSDVVRRPVNRSRSDRSTAPSRVPSSPRPANCL